MSSELLPLRHKGRKKVLTTKGHEGKSNRDIREEGHQGIRRPGGGYQGIRPSGVEADA